MPASAQTQKLSLLSLKFGVIMRINHLQSVCCFAELTQPQSDPCTFVHSVLRFVSKAPTSPNLVAPHHCQTLSAAVCVHLTDFLPTVNLCSPHSENSTATKSNTRRTCLQRLINFVPCNKLFSPSVGSPCPPHHKCIFTYCYSPSTAAADWSRPE